MPGLSSVEKALELLRAVDRHGDTGLGISELARRSDLAKSTAFRLASTLEAAGALERVGDHYRIGTLLGDHLGIPDSPTVELVQIAVTPFLSTLYERTRQTVQLAVLDGPQVCFVNKLHGLHRVASPSRIGGRAPAHCTSIGKAMLAFSPDLTLQVIERGLTRWTSRTITDPDALFAELAKVRRTRVATDDQEYVQGVASIGSVVTDEQDRVVAALCVTGPRDEIVRAGFQPLILHVCASATHAYRQLAASV